MKLRLLVTCAGGLVIPGIINTLRNIAFVDTIVTVDAQPDAIGAFFSDKHFTVPHGNAPDYCQTLLDIAIENTIDVILPFSDEEVDALSVEKNRFKNHGISIVCCDPDQVFTAGDKGSMLTYLDNHQVPVPAFYLPEKKSDFLRYAGQMGYPEKPVIVKPRKGRGGRGVKILKKNIDLRSRQSVLKLEWFLESLQENEYSNFLMMEYLEGQDFSIDSLCRSGKVIAMVPRKRIHSLGGPSQLGEVCQVETVSSLVTSIVKAFNFSGNVNIQVRFRSFSDQTPMVYEINPRLSGTIAAGQAAGVDLLAGGILLATGNALPAFRSPEPIRMIRHFTEYYYRTDTIG